MKTEKQDKILVRLPAEVKRQFKAVCYLKGDTMEGRATQLIIDYLKKAKK